MTVARLAGRVALITGAGGGIGRSLAHAFASDGARVAAVDIRAAAVKEIDGDVLPLVADITDSESVRRIVAETERRLGPIDILVNNAAVTDIEHRHALELPLEVWERILRVNLTGAFVCARAVIPAMQARRRGNIINVTSLLGHWRMGQPGDVAYCASKAALEALTDVLAKELRAHGINVNSLCPYTKLDTGFFAHLPPEAKTDLEDPAVLTGPALFLASLEPGTLTGMSLSDLWWRKIPAYRDGLERVHAGLTSRSAEGVP
ncbi:MAG: SDR family NAD(P)-dependent oxidoreductase [bacterium]